MADRYFFDNCQDDEDERLRRLEEIADPRSISLLGPLGIEGGWRYEEFGAGRVPMVSWLADQVGPSGSVVAVDRNAALCRHLGLPTWRSLNPVLRNFRFPGRAWISLTPGTCFNRSHLRRTRSLNRRVQDDPADLLPPDHAIGQTAGECDATIEHWTVRSSDTGPTGGRLR